jgi:2-haloacid dehalogenase
MPRVSTVIFDIGNVLIRWDPRIVYRRMGFDDATTAAIMAETGLLHVNHRRLDAGEPFAPTLATLANRFPQHDGFIRAFDTRWADMLDGAIEANVAILGSLKQAGVPVHAISNFNREKFDISRARFPFLDAFDELIVSGDVGLVKPDAEIFELLLTRRPLDPATAVFIDDSAANIETAHRLGFATVHYSEGTTDLSAELNRLGIVDHAG